MSPDIENNLKKSATALVLHEKGRAGYPAIFLSSGEDMRSQADVKAAAAALGRKLFIWTAGKGLLEDNPRAKVIDDTDSPPGVLFALAKTGPSAVVPEKSVIMLRLFHHYLNNPVVQSLLLDIIPAFKNSMRMLVISSPVISIPPELEKELALVESQLPGKEQLREVVRGIVIGSNLTKELTPTAERENELIEAALGLTMNEAENAITLSIIRPRFERQPLIWDPRIVMEEKCLALKKTGLLEYIPAVTDMNQIGGLDGLKDWVRKRKRAFGESAITFGLKPPKGVLLVGAPGTGKSLCAKAISAELNLPLLRLDLGKMFGSLVGQSEQNMRQAIQVAEAISPCILWIDEIEKGLAGSSAGALDSGVGARVLGTILTWMQEKKTPVFVYATANDVASLPPELLRKGRFDEMFSVDLPSRSERKEILRIHIEKVGRKALLDNKKIDLEHFAGEVSEGFTGSEIEAAVAEAMYAAFDVNKDLNSFDLQEAFDNTQPLSKTMSEKIKAIREWCLNRTRPANRSEETKVTLPGRSIQA